jgi:hypothetical protein
MSMNGYWNPGQGRISPAQDLITGEELRPGHVQARGRTCLAKVSGIWSKL